MAKIFSDFQVWLHSMVGIAIGGAAGAVEKFLESYLASTDLTHPDFSHLDWHRVGINAAGGALLAICFHFATPPNKGVSNAVNS